MAVQKIFSNILFRVMSTWFAQYITNKFKAEADELRAQIYPAVGMVYVGNEMNVQALAQYGEEGITYILGDETTENAAQDIPRGAMYYINENGVRKFILTNEQEYIITTPVDGSKIEVIYSSKMTYLGGTE